MLAGVVATGVEEVKYQVGGRSCLHSRSACVDIQSGSFGKLRSRGGLLLLYFALVFHLTSSMFGFTFRSMVLTDFSAPGNVILPKLRKPARHLYRNRVQQMGV